MFPDRRVPLAPFAPIPNNITGIGDPEEKEKEKEKGEAGGVYIESRII